MPAPPRAQDQHQHCSPWLSSLLRAFSCCSSLSGAQGVITSRVLSASATWKPRRAPYPRLAPLHLHAAPELGAQTFTHWCFLPPLLASELLDSNLSRFSGSVSQPSQHGGSWCQKPSSFGSDCLFSSLPSLGFLKGSHTKPTARCSLRSLGLRFNRLPEDQVDGEGINSSQQPCARTRCPWGRRLP